MKREDAISFVESCLGDLKTLVPPGGSRCARWHVIGSSDQPDVFCIFVDEFQVDEAGFAYGQVYSRTLPLHADDIREDGGWFLAAVAELNKMGSRPVNIYEHTSCGTLKLTPELEPIRA